MLVDYFDKNELESRRNKILNKMNNFSICLLFAGVSKKETADEEYKFSVNRNFYYLSQIDEEGAVLLLVKTPINTEKYLFILPFDEKKEKWTGKRLTQSQASKLSGIDNILNSDLLKTKFNMILSELNKQTNSIMVYVDLEEENKIAKNYYTTDIKKELNATFDFVNVENIYNTIIEERMVKSHAEIQHIKEAIRITRNGLDQVMLNLRPGLFEYQLAAIFEYSLRNQGNYYTSFNTIAACGINSTILHYPNPISLVNDEETILFDLGCQFRHYCSDISRVYPVNGKFNEIQRKIYEAVLNCNKTVMSYVCPGTTLNSLQEVAKKLLTQSLKEIGIISEDSELIKYYFHNVSHHLGLDTHDPSFREEPLKPGNVITIEPGLYIPELNIGVRIEDDVLVTASGNINLSESIIKEVSDIERLMSTRGVK